MRECRDRDQCPSRNDVRDFLNGTRRECTECIMEECGESSIRLEAISKVRGGLNPFLAENNAERLKNCGLWALR